MAGAKATKSTATFSSCEIRYLTVCKYTFAKLIILHEVLQKKNRDSESTITVFPALFICAIMELALKLTKEQCASS